jgi:hypothetical protein
MSDFPKLCAELIEDISYLLRCVDDGDIDPACIADCRQDLARARAALSEPVVGPVEPSDEDIEDLIDALNGDAMMADPSPAAQAIWAKYNDVLEHTDGPEDLGKPLAAAFRELAARIKVADEIREDVISIANELEHLNV